MNERHGVSRPGIPGPAGSAPAGSAPAGSGPAEAPARSNVRQVEVSPEEQGQRLDKVLGRLLPGVPRSRLFRLIRRGEVRVNGRRAGPEQRLTAGDRVRVPPVREAAPEAPRAAPPPLVRSVQACVLHTDERLLVLDKPAGIAVHGGSGVSFGIIEALRAARPDEELELVHRLDRDTSGILLVARRRSALRTLHALLREGQVAKSYLALVRGDWQLGHCRIDVPLRTDVRVSGERTVKVDRRAGKPSLTEFRLVEQLGRRASLLEATLHTGRTHQIRVHAAHCGHPLAGDVKYGDEAFNTELAQLGLTRMFLHAHSCSFTWPDTGVEQSFSAPLPSELRAVLERLGAAHHRGSGTRR